MLPLIWLWASYRVQQLSTRIVAVDGSRLLMSRALRYAVEAETGLEGYLETKEPLFLHTYTAALPKLERLVKIVPSRLKQAGFDEGYSDLYDYTREYMLWKQTVAIPLLANPKRSDALALQKHGKQLMDRMRGDVLRFHSKGQAVATAAVQRTSGVLIGSMAVTILWVLLVALLTVLLQRRAVRQQNQLVQSLILEREEGGRLSEWRARLLAMLAHDFKSQLAVLIGGSHLLEDFPHRRGDPDLLASLRNASYELAQMADNAILLARAQERKIVLQRTAFDIGEVIETVVQRYGNEREFNIHRSSPTAIVEADRSYCGRVLDNVIGNAVKYSEKPVDVYLSEDAANVKVCVVDLGIGIASEDLPHIFKEFWRSERATWKSKGSGVGLFIVKTIMEAHGGSINVQSSFGHGTTVTMRFPRALTAFSQVPVTA